jgi:uncharacterized repeat protein (TIGR02543 family)
MTSKLLRAFLLFWFVNIMSVGVLWSQCMEIRWVMSFDHVVARPGSRVLIPLHVDFSEIFGGVGKLRLLIIYDQDVMVYSAVKNLDPSVVSVDINQPDSGMVELTWNRQMVAGRQAIGLAGKMLDLEFSYVGGETAVAVSQSEVADIWGNYWQGQITPGSVKPLQAFGVLLRTDPDDTGATLTGGGIYYEGDTVVISADEPFNYRFIHWVDDMPYTAIPDMPESAATSLIMPGREVSLVAQYKKIMENPVFLTLNTVGSGSMLVREVIITDTVIVVPKGEVVVLEAKPDSVWVFDRWRGDASGTNPVVSVVMSRDKEVTASFSELFSVYLLAEPDTVGATLTGAGTYRENERVDIWTTPPEGYLFVGWTGAAQDMALLADPNDMFTSFAMPARPVTFTAVFTPGLPDYYTLTLLASPDTIGAVLSQESPGPHQEGARVDISASDVEGYFFSGWVNHAGGDLSFVDDPVQAETFLIMPAGHITLTATYEEIPPPVKYALNISIVGQGLVLVNGEGYTDQVLAEEGAELSLQALAADGWHFDGWEGDVTESDPSLVVLMDQDKHLTAIFSEQPPPDRLLLIAIVGDGVVTAEGETVSNSPSFSRWFADAAEVVFSAAASAGWVFAGWSGDLTGEQLEVSLTMDADKTVTATFVEEPPPPLYRISFSVADQHGEPITDATISMGDTSHPPGLYVFSELLPGSYSYSVSCMGYFDVSGTVQLVDEDVYVNVVLHQDDTRADVDISRFERIRFYPNPVKDVAILDMEKASLPGNTEVKIIDIRGRIMDVPSSRDAGILWLDCSGLVSGLYHMLIRSGSNEEAIPFVRL